MRPIIRMTITLSALIQCSIAFSQGTASNPSGVTNFPIILFDKVTKKANDLDAKITERTDKTLQKLKKQEQKIKQKLYRKDSALAKSVFENYDDRYDEFIQKLRSNDFTTNPRKVGEYLPNVDSLKTMLGFLGSDQQLLSNVAAGEKAKQALAALNGIQSKLKYVSEIRNYIKKRKNLLTSMLGKHDVASALKRMNKEVYYYGHYVQEYKSVLNDPLKMEKLAINMLNKVPAFKEFAQKNSFVSSLFASNDLFAVGNADNMNIPGLQTRAQVGQVVNTSMLSGGSNSQDIIGQQMASAKSGLDNLKGKISAWDDNAELPDFKPNEMKSKSFLKKLEFGTSLQFGKSNSWLPSTAVVAGQVAYKFHQNGNFGLGASYKLGFGSLRQVSFSHQGIGLRSFLDYKLKGTFFVNGGFEYNYNAGFRNIEQLRELSAWQSSALMGISKKYRVSKKLKGNVVVLYDFFHKVNVPETQPIVFRFGYNF